MYTCPSPLFPKPSDLSHSLPSPVDAPELSLHFLLGLELCGLPSSCQHPFLLTPKPWGTVIDEATTLTLDLCRNKIPLLLIVTVWKAGSWLLLSKFLLEKTQVGGKNECVWGERRSTGTSGLILGCRSASPDEINASISQYNTKKCELWALLLTASKIIVGFWPNSNSSCCR